MLIITDAIREAARVAAREHQKRAEIAIRSLLGQWVSELDPSVAYDEEYRVIGLGHGGKIVLSAAEEG